MATVAERFWSEILDVRRPLEREERPRDLKHKAVLVRTNRGLRATRAR